MPAHWLSHPDGSVSLLGGDRHELDRLQRFFQRLAGISGHYRVIQEQLKQTKGTDPIELFRHFPITSRDDYRLRLQPEALERLASERFVCDYSSGSTGQCVLRLATPADELAEQAVTEQVFRRAGMQAGDTFVCVDVGFPEIYEFYARAARSLGVDQTTFLHLNRDYQRSLEPLPRLAPQVLLTLPSLLARCWPHLRSLWPPGRSPIRSMIFMGEPMPAELRQEVAQTLGCRLFSFYGTTETGGVAGECDRADGCHFHASQFGATILCPEFLDDETVQGELCLTTWLLRDQPVVKYAVGDIVRLTKAPCVCGDPRPRLTPLARAQEGFVLAGLKLRYQTVLHSLQTVAADLDRVTILLSDLPESDGHTLMRLVLPERFAPRQSELLDVLQHRIFELDDLYHFGLVRFMLQFNDTDWLDSRKQRHVIDHRRYLGPKGLGPGSRPGVCT